MAVKRLNMDVLPERIRTERNRHLALSDWTQVSDAPLTTEQRASWTTYRQALRDIPAQNGFPNEVSWPQAPA